MSIVVRGSLFPTHLTNEVKMNFVTNIQHNGKIIAISAHDAVNKSEIEIKVFAGDGFGVEDLSMFVPMSSAKMISEKYLQMCAERLINAQVWDY